MKHLVTSNCLIKISIKRSSSKMITINLCTHVYQEIYLSMFLFFEYIRKHSVQIFSVVVKFRKKFRTLKTNSYMILFYKSYIILLKGIKIKRVDPVSRKLFYVFSYLFDLMSSEISSS